MTRLELAVERRDGPGETLVLEDPLLVVAGYTGRREADVRRHIAELAAIGVAPPASVPTFYRLPNWLLAGDAEALQVAAPTSSGEAEPVLIRMPDGALYVTVGSDQTDRELEATSIALSKLVCPKVVARSAWPYDEVGDAWDDLELRSAVGADHQLYQDGRLDGLRQPMEILALAEQLLGETDRPLVLFLGTVPLLDEGFALDQPFEATLRDTRSGRMLRCTYRTATVNPDATVAFAVDVDPVA